MTAMPTRREKIEAMLVDEPGDVFLRYSLAMELDKEGDHDASLAKLGELTREQPPTSRRSSWPPSNWPASAASSEARTFLRDGIEAARQQDDAHAAGEMSEFLASLGALANSLCKGKGRT